MRSRYDYMKESNTVDIDNEKFPDPLSTTFNDIQLTKVPPQIRVTDPDITKFWLFMNKFMRITCINSSSHIKISFNFNL